MDVTLDSGVPERPSLPPGIAGRRVPWTLRDVIVGILWFAGVFVAGQVLVLPFAIAYGADGDGTYASAFIIGAAVEVGIAAVAANLTIRRYGGGAALLGLRVPDRTALLWALGAWLGALAVSFAWAGVIEAFNIDFLKTECAEQIPRQVRDERALLALASIVVIVFAPVCEELFFRGFVFPGLLRRWGLVAAVIVTGLLFSGAHISYKSFVPIAGVGMVFAYSYYRSGNIFTAMLAHVAFNSLSIAFIAGGSCN